MTWIMIKDADGQDSLMNTDNIVGLKAAVGGGTMITTSTGIQNRILTSFVDLKSQLVDFQSWVDPSKDSVGPQLLQEDETQPEPMKAPQGKVGSGESKEKVIEKLTLPKVKSGTTSSALG